MRSDLIQVADESIFLTENTAVLSGKSGQRLLRKGREEKEKRIFLDKIDRLIPNNIYPLCAIRTRYCGCELIFTARTCSPLALRAYVTTVVNYLRGSSYINVPRYISSPRNNPDCSISRLSRSFLIYALDAIILDIIQMHKKICEWLLSVCPLKRTYNVQLYAYNLYPFI